MLKKRIIFLVIILIFILVFFVHIDARLPGIKKTHIALPKIYGGDEEHYLVMTSSIIEDFDLELKNNYHNARYSGSYCAGEWWREKKLDHHSWLVEPAYKEYIYAGFLTEEQIKDYYANEIYKERPYHPFGMPLMASFPLFPFAGSKYLETCAITITLLFSLALFYFLYKILIFFYSAQQDKKCAETILFFSLGTPLLFYSFTFFKEIYVALTIVLAVYLLFIKKSYFLAGSAISFGLFAKYQMPYVCVPLFLYLILEKNMKGILKMSAVLLIGIIVLMLYNYWSFGDFFRLSQHEFLSQKRINKSIIMVIMLVAVLGVTKMVGIICGKLKVSYQIDKIRVPIKIIGVVAIILFVMKSNIMKIIVFDTKHGLLCFSPFLVFSIIEMIDIRFWKDKRMIFIMLTFAIYTINLFDKGLSIGSAFSLRTIVSILPLLALPFMSWYTKSKKWKVTRILFICLISFSIFINVLAAIAKIHFWHFNMRDALIGSIKDSIKWHEYKIEKVNLDSSVKNNIVYHLPYEILCPEQYDKIGKFSIVIKEPKEFYKQVFIAIKGYVVYKDNYIKIYIADNRVVYLKGERNKEKMIKKTFNITKMLKQNGEVVVSGKMLAKSDVSKELFDSRFEEILILLE